MILPGITGLVPEGETIMDSVEIRRNEITSLINEKGEITFADLKEAFPNVSDMTLRTDLKNLDEEKRIVRIYGGAKSVEVVVGTDDYLGRRSIRNVEAKKEIAIKAKEMIHPGMTIFLDSGSTTTMLASVLEDQANLIVTSSISCAMELAKLSKPKVMVPGGFLNRYSMSICGIQGIKELQNMSFDLAFIGVTSYSEDFGFSCNVHEETVLKQSVLKQAKKKVILMDSSKLDRQSTFSISTLRDVDAVISDGRLTASFLKTCEENQVIVY